MTTSHKAGLGPDQWLRAASYLSSKFSPRAEDGPPSGTVLLAYLDALPDMGWRETPVTMSELRDLHELACAFTAARKAQEGGAA